MEGISEKSPSHSGSWCVFVKVNETHGLKFYKSERERNEARAAQERAYACNCGPAVGGNAEMDFLPNWEKPWAWKRDPEKVFGYVTEIVETDDELDEEEFSELTERLIANGFNVRDLTSYSNVGRRKDGTTVAYDFDPVYNNANAGERQKEYAIL